MDLWTQSILELSQSTQAKGIDLRCILVNNGEEPRPFQEVCRQLERNSVRFLCLNTPDREKSLGRCRQLILQESSTGDFLCMMDPDCLWSPEALLALVQALVQNKELNAVGPVIQSNLDKILLPLNRFYRSPQASLSLVSGRHSRSKKNQLVTMDHTSYHFVRVDHLPTTFVVIRVCRDMLAFNPAFHRTGEDLEWGLRMTKKFEFAVTDAVSVNHRVSTSIRVQFDRLFRFGYIQPFAAQSARRLSNRLVRALCVSFFWWAFMFVTSNIWLVPCFVMGLLLLAFYGLSNFRIATTKESSSEIGSLKKFIGIILLPIPYMSGVVWGCFELIYRRQPRF